ncbi:cardiolipin synthase [Clostridium polynesiense]|uniref:cardiolipin synthase n=1 Tax=Clostridium polynesiense TaxID=1325933 RepID=UPI00058EAF65|nr:cardiolipin synthase [Clostridium polynesiense]
MSIEAIIFIINLLLIISVVFIEYKNPNEALLWVAVLCFLPVAGIIFYLIFGSTFGIKLTYMIRNNKLNNGYRQVLYKQLEQIKNQHLASSSLNENQLAAMVRFNLNYSESLITQNNRIEQIVGGEEKYKRMFSDMLSAEKSIHVQYYSIHNDIIGKKLIDILALKASQGLKVLVMYDGIGSITTPKSLFKPLMDAGGEVKRLKPFLTHFRNHRKIVVIDGKIAYTGGMNIGKQYVNLHKVKTPWRDTQIRIQGDGVYILQYYFLSDWFYSNKPKSIKIKEEELASLFPEHSIKDELFCQFVAGGVNTHKEYTKMSYLKMITSAKKKIYLQSPYFIPDNTLMDAFKMAAASGVDINIMIPNISPSFFLEPVGNYYISELIDYGVKVYKYKGYIHAKTMSIDSIASCIGSVNMDMRSLQVDDEICAFIYDDHFAEEYEKIFEKDIKNSIELDYEAFKNRGLKERILERFFRLFAPLM